MRLHLNPDKISITSITGNLIGQDFTTSLNTYAVSGKVTSGSGGLAGVTVALGAYSATTGDDGKYSISGVPDGTTADLIPALAGYGFTPGSRSVNGVSGPLTGQDFTAALNTYPISGKVTLTGGGNLKGVKVALGLYSANTADDGTYMLSNVPYGTAGDLTPSLAGYSFTPNSRRIDNLTGPLTTGLDFTAALNTYTISGKVTSTSGGLAGVTVALNGYSALTGADGKYTISSVPYGTAGDLTPSKTGYSFSPNKTNIASLFGNLTNKDFAATLNTYAVSGKITSGGSGLKGVTVSVGANSDITDDNGNYSISNVPYGTTADLTPSLAGYGFSQTPARLIILSGPLGGQDFTAALNTYAISGKVTSGSGGLENVTVTLNGYNAVTDADGKYTLSSVPYGTAGDLTPSNAGYTFSPQKITITSLTGTLTNADSTATLNTYAVSGTITLNGGGPIAGVTVALNGHSALRFGLCGIINAKG